MKKVIGFLLSSILILVSCATPMNKIGLPSNQYSVIWKYQVKPQYIETFEHEYGFEGTWFKLFSESKEYKGSFLHKSETEPNTYLLIDTWSSKQAYEDFKMIKRDLYNSLSIKFEYLYETEEKIGSYDLVNHSNCR